jgi:hypothetical protein
LFKKVYTALQIFLQQKLTLAGTSLQFIKIINKNHYGEFLHDFCSDNCSAGKSSETR